MSLVSWPGPLVSGMQESLRSGKMNQFVSSAPILLCLMVLYTRLVSSQDSTYGIPPLCLLSRTDVVNCSFSIQSTPRPKENQYGVYQTRIRSGSTGLPTCKIRRRKHQIRDIEILGKEERVKFIFSPGKELNPPQDYASQMIVFYNIRCPAGHTAFFGLARIAVEERVCFDQASNTNRCVDYVQVKRGEFGVTEYCGNTPHKDNINQLQEGPLDIMFRTGGTNKFAGFEAVVVCFRRQAVNMEGCTRPGYNSRDSMDTSGTSANTRKKRDLDDFNNEWKSRLASIKRMRRQTVSREEFLRFEEINVTHGVDVFYENGVITFINSESNMEIREAIKNITLLRTFDANGDIDEFKGVAKNEFGDLMCLPGPGPMKILGQCAYFQTFAVVRVKNLHHVGILKMDAFDQLIQAQLDYTLGRGPMHLGRRRCQIESKVGEDALITAIRIERACNPVLRRLALATIDNEDPAVVDKLRKLMAVQCPELPPIPNGFITYAPDDTPAFDIGTKASYQCDPGFFLVHGDMTRVCVVDEDSRGVFNGEEPVCKLQCAELPPIPNGIVTYIPDETPDFDIGTVAIYQCDHDFLLVGDMTRVCVEDEDSRGVFNGETPVCQILQCPELPPISNGFITYAPDETPDFDIGTTATYQCNPDFLLVGVITRVCVEGTDSRGVFSGVPPVCQELLAGVCGAPPSIPNGHPESSTRGTVTYSCNSGYTVSGSATVSCLADGEWSSQPTCAVLVQCPALPPILNGFITYGPDDTPDFDNGTVATYQCNPDFFLVGDTTTRVCGQDGFFDGEAPVCQPAES